ncbi:MAG: hypothetical protein RLZZ65_1491 [Bacteroidota bacterium]|jgi:phosphopantetheinyl transferase
MASMNFDSFQIHPLVQLKSARFNSLQMEAVFLYPEEKSQIIHLQSEKRKKEFLMARQLRNTLQIQSPIFYDENGKPYLDSALQTHISITHSSDILVFGKSSIEIGIDLEKIQSRITRMIGKFASEQEKNLAATISWSEEEWQTTLWCAKEAIYKLCGLRGLAFKEEISVLTVAEIEKNRVLIQAKILRPQSIKNKIELIGLKDEGFAFALAYFKD